MVKLALLVVISFALLLNTTFGEDNNVTNDSTDSRPPDAHYEKRADSKTASSSNDDSGAPFYTNRGRRHFQILSQTPFLYPSVIPWSISKKTGEFGKYNNPSYTNRGRLYYEYEQEPLWLDRGLRAVPNDYTARGGNHVGIVNIRDFADNSNPLWDRKEPLEEDGPYWASRGRRELVDENTVSVSYGFPNMDLSGRRQGPLYAEEPEYILLRRDLDPSPSPIVPDADPFFVARGKRPEDHMQRFVNNMDQEPFYGARGKRSVDQDTKNANAIKDNKKDLSTEKRLNHSINKRESDSKNDLIYNLMVHLSENKKSNDKSLIDDVKSGPVVVLEKGRSVKGINYNTVPKINSQKNDVIDNIVASLSSKPNKVIQYPKIGQVKRDSDKRDITDILANSEQPFFGSRGKKFIYVPERSYKNKVLINLLLNKYNSMMNVYDVKRTKATSSDQIFYNKMNRMHRNDADVKDPFFAHRGKKSKVVESPFYAHRGRRVPDVNDNPFFAHRGKRQFDDNYNPFFAHRGKRDPDDNFNPFFAHRGKRSTDASSKPFYALRGKRSADGNDEPFFPHRGKRTSEGNDDPFFAHRGRRTNDDSPFFAHRGKRVTEPDNPSFVQFGKRFPDGNDNPFFAHRGKRLNLELNDLNPFQDFIPEYEEDENIEDVDFEYE